MFRLPPARTRQVTVRRDVPVPAPGGVTLLTDVYLSGSAWAADRRAGYFPGGSFALERALTWTYLMSTQGSQLRAMVRAKQALAPAFGHLPLLTADEAAAGIS